jgi:hypothetical protein
LITGAAAIMAEGLFSGVAFSATEFCCARAVTTLQQKTRAAKKHEEHFINR